MDTPPAPKRNSPASAAEKSAPEKPGAKPAAPAAPAGTPAKALAFYDRLFPPDSERRKYGWMAIAGIVLVVLLLAKCAVSSAGDKISEISQAHAEAKRIASTGILVVKSNRSNATLEAAHVPAAGEAAEPAVPGAPAQPLPNLTPGKYRLTLRAEGWPDAHGEVDVPAGRTTETAVNFPSGSLKLDSDPSGAIVRLGAADLGKTPLTIPELPPGEVSLALEYPNWKPVRVKVAIKENTEVSETVRLPHGKLTVESAPAGATVLMGGKAWGQTPLFFERLPAGPVKLTLQAKDFPPLEIALTLEDRAEAKVSRELGTAFPELDPAALLRAVWIATDPNQIAPRVDSTGIYEPRNGVVKNLNRKRLYETWLRKSFRYAATVKAYDAKNGKVEFVEQENAYSKFRVTAELTPEARADKDLAAKLTAKGVLVTLQIYGRLTAAEEPRWPAKVITFELSDAAPLH